MQQFDDHEPSNTVACVIEDGSVEIRSLDRDELRRLLRTDQHANAVAISGDGQQLYIGTIEGPVLIYDTRTWSQTDTIPLHLGGIYDIAFGPHGQQVAVCTGGSWVQLLDKDSFQEEDSVESIAKWSLPTRITSLVFDDDDDLLYGAGMDGNVYRLDPDNSTFHRWKISGASLSRLSWLKQGVLAVVSPDRVDAIDVLNDSAVPKEILRTEEPISAGTLVQANAIVIGSGSGRLESVEPDLPKQNIGNFGSAVQSLKWLAMRKQLLIGLADGRLLLSSMKRRDTLDLHRTNGRISAGMIAPRHQILITLDDGGFLRTFDLMTGRPIKEVAAHHDAGWAISGDRMQNFIATVGEDRRLCCYGLPDLDLRFEAFIDWGVRDVCVSPDGKWIAAAPPERKPLGQREGSIGLWDAGTGEPNKVLTGHKNWVVRLAFNGDGSQLASASVDLTSRTWEIPAGRQLHVFAPAKTSQAEHLLFDDDNDRLFIGHRDGWVTSWDTRRGTPGATWAAFGDALSGIMKSGDRLIATCRSNPTVRVRDLGRGTDVAVLNLGIRGIAHSQASPESDWFAFVGSDGQTLIRQVEQTSPRSSRPTAE